METNLLVIDMQNDFVHPQGALSIPGAMKDAANVASLIKLKKHKIGNIFVTLDRHHQWDVGHPTFWIDKDGNRPQPFTQIMAEDIKKDKWQVYSTAYEQVGQDLEIPGSDTLREHVLKYATYLENYYNQGIDIWPEHCIMNTWGEKLHPFVDEAICDWEKLTGKQRTVVEKGKHPYTEHYSAIAPILPLKHEHAEINEDLRNELDKSEQLWVVGEAESHCVKDTLYDFLHDRPMGINLRTILLSDCMSPVPVTPGPERAEQLRQFCTSNGVRILTLNQLENQ